MANLFYIRNTKTDQNYDTNEGKFFDSNWQPEYSEDRGYLQSIIDSDSNEFDNCKVEAVEYD